MEAVSLSSEFIGLLIGSLSLFFTIISAWIVRDRQISKKFAQIELMIQRIETKNSNTFAKKSETMSISTEILKKLSEIKDDNKEICRRIDRCGGKSGNII